MWVSMRLRFSGRSRVRPGVRVGVRACGRVYKLCRPLTYMQTNRAKITIIITICNDKKLVSLGGLLL